MDDIGKYLIFIYLVIPIFNFYQLYKLNIKILENLKSSFLVLLSLFAGVPIFSVIFDFIFSWIFKFPLDTYLIFSSILFIFFYFHRFKSRTVKMGKIVYRKNKYKNLLYEIVAIVIFLFTAWIGFLLIKSGPNLILGENIDLMNLSDIDGAGIRAGFLIFIYNLIVKIFGSLANEVLGLLIIFLGGAIEYTLFILFKSEGIRYFRKTYFEK